MESNISDGSCGEFHLSYHGCIPTNLGQYNNLIRSSTKDLVKEIIKQTAIRTRRHVVEAADDGINNDNVYNSVVVEPVQEENEGEEDPSENSVKSITPPQHTPPEVIIIHSDEED